MGDYEVVGRVGRGCVLKVRREGAVFAMKCANPVEGALERHVSEVGQLRQVAHPNVARVHAVGAVPAHGDWLYAVMDLVEGAPLLSWIRSANIHYDALVRMFAKIARALDGLHGSGVCHRNLESGTVLVRSGDFEPVLVGYGMVPPGRGSVAEHAVPRLAPERCAWLLDPGESTDRACLPFRPAEDHYALGVILYEALTRRHPCLSRMDRAKGADALRRIRDVSPVDPRGLRTGVPETLAGIALDLLAKEPSSRQAACQTLRSLLDHAAA